MRNAAIKDLVRQECLRERNVFGPCFLDEHIAVVADYAVRLAGVLGGDCDVVEVAAWLHDISAVRDISTLANHADASAEIALELLREFGYPPEFAEQVAKCVRSHSSPLAIGEVTVEEVCVSNADAIAQIVRPAFWCYFAYGIRRMAFEEGRRWMRGRKQNNWAAMIEPARRMAREGYETYVNFLRDFEHPLSALDG